MGLSHGSLLSCIPIIKRYRIAMPNLVPASARKPARPGRPPVLTDRERNQRLVEAAEQVFVTVGYGAASMEEIARVAGMSKKTLYSRFSDKARLFAAVIGDADAFSEDLVNAPLPDPVSDLRQRLFALADFALTPRQLKLTRLVISEARQYPNLADEFHKRLMQKGVAYLERGVNRLGQFENPTAVAIALAGAALGHIHIHALFGNEKLGSRAQISAQIETALALILPQVFQMSFTHSPRS